MRSLSHPMISLIAVGLFAAGSLAQVGCKKTDDAAKDDKSSKKKGDDDEDDKGSKAKKKKEADDDDKADTAKKKKKKSSDDDDKGGDAKKFSCADSLSGKVPDEVKVGATFTIKCPDGCTSGSVWGSGQYTTDSSLCVSAVHAGASNTEAGATVTVKVTKGLDTYRGSKMHGITSTDWGHFDKSFVFPGHSDDLDINSKFSCTESVNGLKKSAGDSFNVECMAGCDTKGAALYGTGTYTGDSSICIAAIHAGVIKANKGGKVAVKVGGKKTSFKGSEANDVTSSNWGAYDVSFSVDAP